MYRLILLVVLATCASSIPQENSLSCLEHKDFRVFSHCITKRSVDNCYENGCFSCRSGNCATTCRGSSCRSCPSGSCCDGNNCNVCSKKQCCSSSSCNRCANNCREICDHNTQCREFCTETCITQHGSSQDCRTCEDDCVKKCPDVDCRSKCTNSCSSCKRQCPNEQTVNNCRSRCSDSCSRSDTSCNTACSDACHMNYSSPCQNCFSNCQNNCPSEDTGCRVSCRDECRKSTCNNYEICEHKNSQPYKSRCEGDNFKPCNQEVRCNPYINEDRCGPRTNDRTASNSSTSTSSNNDNKNIVATNTSSSNSNPHTNDIRIGLTNTITNINNISNPIEVKNTNYVTVTGSNAGAKECSGKDCNIETLPYKNATRDRIIEKHYIERYPISVPFERQIPRCQPIPQPPYISCSQQQAPQQQVSNCNSCFYCGGQFNPQMCSSQSSCSNQCRSMIQQPCMSSTCGQNNMYSSCGSCFHCGGQYNPQYCSSLSSCSNTCRNAMFSQQGAF